LNRFEEKWGKSRFFWSKTDLEENAKSRKFFFKYHLKTYFRDIGTRTLTFSEIIRLGIFTARIEQTLMQIEKKIFWLGKAGFS